MTGPEQLIDLCRRLGAPPEQARRMAEQLWKRADQIASERRLTREAALAYLLDLVVKGRAGEVPEGFVPPPATPPPAERPDP